MNTDSVLIGLSGGVDSSVAAHLLQREGYDCIGCTMKLWCGNSQDNTADAKSVADRMGIPFHVFDHQEEFHCRVIGDLSRATNRAAPPIPAFSATNI